LEHIFEYSNIFIDAFVVKREQRTPAGGNFHPAKQIGRAAAVAADSSRSMLEQLLSLNGSAALSANGTTLRGQSHEAFGQLDDFWW